MRSHLWRIGRVVILAAVTLAPSLAVMPQALAFTAPSLSVPLYAHQALTHADGSMSFAECYGQAQAYSTQRIITVDVGGNTLTSLPKPPNTTTWAALNCEDQMVAGYDSTVYVVESKGSGTGYTNYRIAAYKFGAQRWTWTFPPTCPSYQREARPKWLTLGYDGNLYAVMSTTNCATPDQLVSINASDGTSRFTPIQFSQDVSNITHWRPRVATYNSGLVLLDGSVLKYYSYTGQSSQASYTLPLTSGEYFDDAVFTAGGTVLVAVKKSGQACTGINRVVSHTPAGADTSYSTTAACPKPGVVRAMPDGGLLLQHTTLYENRLLRYSPSGTLLYNVDVLSISGYSQVWVAWPQVDANGNVVVVRSGVNTSSDRHTLVDVVSPTGIMQRVWDTLGLNTAAKGEVFDYTQGERFAMRPGELYVPICAGTCSASNPVTIYKVSIAGLGYDYPRSSWIAAQPAQLNYVALGDSFSSGEGVPPFISGTDTSTNGCHRSTQAYAMLLDQDPALNLNLQSFRACSGATTQTMVSGQGDNGNQLDAITADTDVVTLTVGGNNVEFATFVENCLTPGTGGCAEGTESYNLVMQRIDQLLPGHLTTLFGQIQTQLTNANTTAKVYVVGYPFVLREHPFAACNLGQIGSDEERAAENITMALDARIAEVVVGMNDSRFNYIDPLPDTSSFTDHDLCGGGPSYFNAYVLGQPQEYTAHPNTLGQEAYASLIKIYMQNS